MYTTCQQQPLLQLDNYQEINDRLFDGFYRIKRTEFSGYSLGLLAFLFLILTAYDFKEASLDTFSVSVFYNDTVQSAPQRFYRVPGLIRMNKNINIGVQMFLRYVTNSTLFSAFLSGIKEMPKPETSLNLDFASILGPLFYVWVLQLVFPTMITSMVYEKESKLRDMMSVMGLSPRAYGLITYTFFLFIYIIYIVVFVVLGTVARESVSFNLIF